MLDASILPSLISAGAVLAGAGLQQAFSLLGKRAEHKLAMRKLRREKLEALADLLSQSQVLTLEALSFLAKGNYQPESAKAVGKSLDEVAVRVYSLSLLFFPTLKVLSEAFLKALNELQSALLSDDEEAMISAAGVTTQARKAFEKAIERHAKELGFHG